MNVTYIIDNVLRRTEATAKNYSLGLSLSLAHSLCFAPLHWSYKNTDDLRFVRLVDKNIETIAKLIIIIIITPTQTNTSIE